MVVFVRHMVGLGASQVRVGDVHVILREPGVDPVANLSDEQRKEVERLRAMSDADIQLHSGA